MALTLSETSHASYRSLVGNRLVEGRTPVLPPWRGNVATAFRRGAASSGVILAYLAPFLIGFWVFGVRTASVPFDHWREFGAFAAAPLSRYWRLYGQRRVDAVECADACTLMHATGR